MGNRQKSDSREFRSGIINEEVKPEFCELKPEMGPCTGSFLRYFYNSSIDECSSFYYGGCDGNENNFHTLFACNAICQEPNTTEDDIIFKVSFEKKISKSKNIGITLFSNNYTIRSLKMGIGIDFFSNCQ